MVGYFKKEAGVSWITLFGHCQMIKEIWEISFISWEGKLVSNPGGGESLEFAQFECQSQEALGWRWFWVASPERTGASSDKNSRVCFAFWKCNMIKK